MLTKIQLVGFPGQYLLAGRTLEGWLWDGGAPQLQSWLTRLPGYNVLLTRMPAYIPMFS